MLFADHGRPSGGGVVCRAEQQSIVTLGDQLLGDRCGDGRSALIVDDIYVQVVEHALYEDATLGVDPILAKEVALFGHLAAGRLTSREGEDRPNIDWAAHWPCDDGRTGCAGCHQRTDRDQPGNKQSKAPHEA